MVDALEVLEVVKPDDIYQKKRNVMLHVYLSKKITNNNEYLKYRLNENDVNGCCDLSAFKVPISNVSCPLKMIASEK